MKNVDMFSSELVAERSRLGIPADVDEKPRNALFRVFCQQHEYINPQRFTAWARLIAPEYGEKETGPLVIYALRNGWIEHDPTFVYRAEAIDPGRRASGSRRSGYRSNIWSGRANRYMPESK